MSMNFEGEGAPDQLEKCKTCCSLLVFKEIKILNISKLIIKLVLCLSLYGLNISLEIIKNCLPPGSLEFL